MAVDKPHPDFEPGNPIVSSEVNDNFDALYEAVTVLEEPRAFVKYRTNVAQEFSSPTPLDFELEAFDNTGGAVTHDGGEWTFTAPEDGHYLVSAQLMTDVFPTAGNGWADLRVHVNGNFVDGTTGNHSPTAASIRGTPGLATVLLLSAGDEVQIAGDHHSTGNLAGGPRVNWVSVAQLD